MIIKSSPLSFFTSDGLFQGRSGNNVLYKGLFLSVGTSSLEVENPPP